MNTISLCMIVKNEESVLARCLDCVKDIVDEIIIVDTGSTDQTKKIAAQYTDKIYDFEWTEDFAAARNFAFSKGTCEWLMWLDADDIIEKESILKILDLKEKILNSTNYNCIVTRYDTSFDAQGNVSMFSLRERILKKDRNFKWIGRIHEVVDGSSDSSILIPDIIITHKKNKSGLLSYERNLNIYKKMIKEGIELNERDLFHCAVEYLNMQYYIEAIDFFKKSLEKEINKTFLYHATIAHLSECYIQTQQYEKCLDLIFNYLKNNPPQKSIVLKLAKCYYDNNELEHAIKWFDMCIAIKEKNLKLVNLTTEDWLCHQHLCNIYYNLKDYESALKENSFLLELFPLEKGYQKNKEQILEKIREKEKDIIL